MPEQAQRLQKRELDQQRNGADGEDVHMSSAKTSNAERQRKRKRARGDVEMADAEVQSQLALSFESLSSRMLSQTQRGRCHHDAYSGLLRSFDPVAEMKNAIVPLSNPCIVALQDDTEESKQQEEPEVAVPKLDIPDLRQILKRQDEPRATGMFSAAEFIALDDDEAEPQEPHEDGREGAMLTGTDTVTAMTLHDLTGTVDEQAPLPADMASSDLA